MSTDETSQDALRHAGSAFFLVRPRSNNNQMMYDQAMLAAQANAMANVMANMQQQQGSSSSSSNDPMSPLQRMQVKITKITAYCVLFSMKYHMAYLLLYYITIEILLTF